MKHEKQTTGLEEVQHERALARTFVELRQVVTRIRMAFPNLTIVEILMLAGIVEQAKSEGMKELGQSLRRVPPKKAPPALPAKASAPPPVKSKPTPPFERGLKVTVGTKNVPFITVASRLLVERGPMTLREIFDTFEEKGWKINTKSPHMQQVVRALLTREDKTFQKVASPNNEVKFRARANNPKRTHAASNPKGAPSKEVVRKQTLRLLAASHGKPISIADLAEKLKIPNAQRLVPLLVSLSESGAVKKLTKGDETLWEPFKDKIKAYDTERGGIVFSKAHVEALNGVAHA